MLDHTNDCSCGKCTHVEPTVYKVNGFIHPTLRVHVPHGMYLDDDTEIWYVVCSLDSAEPRPMSLMQWNYRAEEGKRRQ